MRFLVKIMLKKNNVVIPYDHQYYLASYIYRTIEKIDKSYALEPHKPKCYKFFTFSYLMAEKRENLKKGILIKSNEAYFYVSSPDKKFMKNLLKQCFVIQR